MRGSSYAILHTPWVTAPPSDLAPPPVPPCGTATIESTAIVCRGRGVQGVAGYLFAALRLGSLPFLWRRILQSMKILIIGNVRVLSNDHFLIKRKIRVIMKKRTRINYMTFYETCLQCSAKQ